MLIRIPSRVSRLAAVGVLAAVINCAPNAVPEAAAATLEVKSYVARNFPAQPFFKPVCNMKLTGRIRPDDRARIEKQLDEFRLSPLRPADYRDFIDSDERSGYYALCLNSSGGDIREALRIGDLFRGWMTVVEADEECVSACAILFMMGERRDHLFVRIGPGPPPRLKAGRHLHYRAKLGFHAPRLAVPANEPLTAARVEAEYDRALSTVRALVFRGAAELATDDENVGDNKQPSDTDNLSAAQIARILDNDSYIRGLLDQSQASSQFIPYDLLLAILAVPANDVFFVTTIGQAMRWGIEPYGFPPPAFISERMLVIGCGNLVYARCSLGGPHGKCITIGRRIVFSGGLGDYSADEHFEQLRRHFKISTKQLWPPKTVKSPFTVHGFAMTRMFNAKVDKDSYAACEAKLIYRDHQLFEIQLETFNGQGSSLRVGGPDFTAYDAAALTDGSGLVGANNHLRPWKMLPADRKLADLGENPWAELEKGGPLFKP